MIENIESENKKLNDDINNILINLKELNDTLNNINNENIKLNILFDNNLQDESDDSIKSNDNNLYNEIEELDINNFNFNEGGSKNDLFIDIINNIIIYINNNNFINGLLKKKIEKIKSN